MVQKIHTDFRSELENDTICSLLSTKINLDAPCYSVDITQASLKAAKKQHGVMFRNIELQVSACKKCA